MKKMLALVALSAGLLAAPSVASACNLGHYETRYTTSRQWVPATTTQVKVKVWVPGQIYYVHQTVVVRNGCYTYDNYGRRIWNPPVTRQVRVARQRAGHYRWEYRTKTIPGYYRNAQIPQRTWISDCRCRYRSNPRVTVRGHISTGRINRELHRSGHKVNRELHRSGRRINRELNRSGHRVNRELHHSGRKTNKEIRRVGRRINKEFRRLFD